MFVLMVLVFEEGKVLVGSFFSSSETSNSMKISLLDGYSEIFSRPENLIFGQGFNAHEWSPELRGMIAMEDPERMAVRRHSHPAPGPLPCWRFMKL